MKVRIVAQCEMCKVEVEVPTLNIKCRPRDFALTCESMLIFCNPVCQINYIKEAQVEKMVTGGEGGEGGEGANL